ncbi:MAG: hypothetical protein DDT40_01029 [candidate division WS2 bacterium]|nr:hypothetical protein [Candidatus Psychracetigena formicireducens]
MVGDGCYLPFKDNSFDVVTSLDSLEHIPEYKKAAYCCEMKRVATGYVIIQCPADSTDGMFLSTVYDTKFLEWHRWHFGKDEMNTAEHLNSGLPKVEELMKLFPGAQISGKQNCELWLRYMKGAFMPYVRIIVGLFYKAFVLKRDNQPPYKSCLLIWRKE